MSVPGVGMLMGCESVYLSPSPRGPECARECFRGCSGRLLDHHLGPSCPYPYPYSCHSLLMSLGAIPCPLKPIKSQMITLLFLKSLRSLSLCLTRNPKSLQPCHTTHTRAHTQAHTCRHTHVHTHLVSLCPDLALIAPAWNGLPLEP